MMSKIMVLCIYHAVTVQMFRRFSLCHASAFVSKRVILLLYVSYLKMSLVCSG